MFGSRALRLAALLSLVAVAATGCRGCMRENIVYEHTFNRPDCGMKPCPREYPEFELPPGGPYLYSEGREHARIRYEK